MIEFFFLILFPFISVLCCNKGTVCLTSCYVILDMASGFRAEKQQMVVSCSIFCLRFSKLFIQFILKAHRERDLQMFITAGTGLGRRQEPGTNLGLPCGSGDTRSRDGTLKHGFPCVVWVSKATM